MMRASKKPGLQIEEASNELSLDLLILSIDQLNQNIAKLRLARSQRSPTSMASSSAFLSPPKLKFSETEPNFKIHQQNDAHRLQSKRSKNPCASPIHKGNVHLLSPNALKTPPKQNNMIYAPIGPAHR